MDSKTLARVKEFENNNAYYDALQFYRTKLTRSFRVKNGADQVIPLVKYAVDYFLKEKQHQCAADIITLFCETLSKNNVPTSELIFAVISETAAKIATIATNEYKDGNEQNENILASARRRFVDIALQWTKNQAESNQDKKYGSSRLHYFLANHYLRVDEDELARNHFLLSDNPAEFAEFLIKVWKFGANDSEFELVIAQAVLQLLCIDRFPFASETFKAYTSHQTENPSAPFTKPLLNFVQILLEVIAKVDVSQYSVIVETYMPEISRDDTFKGYLSKIGKIYFGIREESCTGGGLAGLLSGIMGGGDTKEEFATSHLSSSDSTVKAPPVMSAPLPHLKPQVVKNKPSNAMEVDELD